MYVLRGIPVVTMGYSIDSLDVCFGDQLAGSVTLGIDTSPSYLLFQTLLPLFWTLTCMI